ncbi:MAG: helix-turn-helix transcriptional regulator [Armatimonadota bacterium]
MRRKHIHNYLKRCRKECGLSQKEVARILGLESSSMISRWEKGVSLPETLNALKMAAIYQTTVDYVFEDLRLNIQDELSERTAAVLHMSGRRQHV